MPPDEPRDDTAQFYRDVFALSPDGILLIDAETLFPVLFNDAACRQFGYGREEFAALSITHHSAPTAEDIPRLRAAEALNRGMAEFDIDVRTKAGEGRILHVWARAIEFRGRPAFYAIQRDVTDERRVQEALRHSHDLLDRTGRMAAVGGWQLDPETQALYWTSEVYRIHDLEPGSPIMLFQAIEFYAPEARPVITAALYAAMNHGTPFDLELPLDTARGRRIFVRAQGAPGWVNGRIVHLHGAIQDVTAQRRAAEVHRLKNAALDAAVDAVLITDAEGRIEWVNPAFTRLTGYGASEAVGRNPRDLVRSGRQSREFYAGIWSTILAGHAWHGEIVNRRKDGSEYTEEQTITPILDQAGRVTHFVAIKRDATERLVLRDRIRQSEKMETVGQLASGIAHDFNNLLTVIIGLGELVLGELPGADPIRDDILPMLDAANSAATLTKQLLAFGRRQLLTTTVLNFNTVIAGAEPLLRRLLRDDIVLHVLAAPELGHVNVDAGQMSQVLINLAVNARDAMPDGGRLTIDTRNVTIDAAYAAHTETAIPLGEYVRVAVSDTGIGMDDATRRRMFEPFFTTKAHGKGTGLGLATVYGIVKQSNGFIWVYSEPDRGTSFHIYLPIVDAQPGFVPAPTAATRARGAETILVVEDNPSLRSLTARLLESGGFTVVAAASGVDALRILERRDPPIDLLLTDVVMPGLSGPQIARGAEHLASAPRVLYMSGYTDDEVVRHGVLDASIAFMNKPFTRDSLLRKVREVLDS